MHPDTDNWSPAGCGSTSPRDGAPPDSQRRGFPELESGARHGAGGDAPCAHPSDATLRDVFEHSPDALFIEDLQGFVLEVNRAACQLHNMTRDELVGKNVLDLVPAEYREGVARDFPKLVQGEWTGAEGLSLREDGTPVPVEIRVNRIRYQDRPALLLQVRDVSERKQAEAERRRLEAQMLHAQKLESLGVLAGGIAHDFNNILTTILGNADLGLAQVAESSPLRDCLGEIVDASRRAADLCRQMLAYAGRSRFAIQPLDVSDLVIDMTSFLDASVSKKSALRFDCPTGLPAVEADVSQLRQVVMNLVINASEAIGETDGRVAISTGLRTCDRACLDAACMGDTLPEGRYVAIEVTDNGCGMDAETTARIFDPFFSTKFAGRGLGLAAVLGIVRGHGGAVRVASEPGRGSTFTVLLPPSPVAPQPTPRPDGAQSPVWKGRGKVLVVDDEPEVRQLARRMLEHIGFDVSSACDGREALDVFGREPDAFACVLMDLTMPAMDGAEAARAIKAIRGGVPILLASGYDHNELSERLAADGFAGFIQKPFSLAVLRDSLRSAVGQGP